MKSILNNKTVLKLIILVSFSLFISCGDSGNDKKIVTGKKGSEAKKTESFASVGPISVQKYDVPAGADPKISAEDGGTGFEKIAESLGFGTKTDFYTSGDPRAIKGGSFTTFAASFPVTYRTEGKSARTSQNSEIGSYIYERLLSLDSKTLEYTPSLATHWKADYENQTFYYRLDPNARWSDGKPVTSKDIVATWKLLTDEGILAPYTNQTTNEYEEPQIISKYIFKVKSKQSGWRPFFLFSLTQLLPAHHLDKVDGKGYLEKYQFKMLPGTGPYVLDENKTKKGKQFVMRRRSDYWAEDYKVNKGLNNFDEIIYLIIQDENLRKEKFKKGELDWYLIGRAQWWVNEFSLENPGVGLEGVLDRGLIQKRKIFNFYPKGFGGLCFNMRKPPFDDIRLRKAIAMLWNIDLLNEKLFYNEYKKTASHYPGSGYKNPNNKTVEYNPEEAAKLLDAAGWSTFNDVGIRTNKNGEIFEIDLAIMQSSERIYTPFQEDLNKAGIKLNLVISDWPRMLEMKNERQFKIATAGYTTPIFPNLKQFYSSETADAKNTVNASGFKSKRVDELIEMEREAFDPAVRRRIVQEVDSIAFNSYHYAFRWHPPYNLRIAYWNKFGMPESVFTYMGDNSSIYSTWWHDKDKAKRLEEAKNDKSIILPIGETIVDKWNIRSK